MISAGKFIHGVASHPHCRPLVIPWVMSSRVISCLKARDYGSSSPVRYIPKGSPKTRKPVISSPPINDFEDKDKRNCSNPDFPWVNMLDGRKVSTRSYIHENSPKTDNTVEHNTLDSHTDLPETLDDKNILKRSYIRGSFPRTEKIPTSFAPMNGFEDKVQANSSDSNLQRLELMDDKKNLGRSCGLREKLNQNERPRDNWNINDGPETDDFEDVEEAEESTQKFEGKYAREKLAFKTSKTKQDAENRAIALLAKRAFTTVELRKKLLAKKFPLSLVNEVIGDLQIRGLLNDCLYAETFCRSRFSSLSWGPRRIQQELFRKGVSEVDREKAIELVFRDGEPGKDHESSLRLSKLALDHLFVQASKRWKQCEVEPVDKRKSKIVQWLQYRGFNWGVINFVLKKLESKYPP